MNQQVYLRLKEFQGFSRRVMESQKISHEERYFFLLPVGMELDQLTGCFEIESEFNTNYQKLEQWWKSFSSYMDKLDSVAPFP